MNGHEKLSFNQTPPENNAERQAALERLRQGETTALLEFASSTLPKMERHRAGRIVRIITLFTPNYEIPKPLETTSTSKTRSPLRDLDLFITR